MLLSVVSAKCCAECHSEVLHCDKCHSGKYDCSAEFHSTKCHSAKYHCSGLNAILVSVVLLVIRLNVMAPYCFCSLELKQR